MFFGANFGLDLKCPRALLNCILLLQSDKQDTSTSVVQLVYENYLVRIGHCDGKTADSLVYAINVM